ncbi:MAG: phage terminase large subunit [Planctomycetaceae bacterium]|jgi:predicted phage terminase large subunit-like protein|nr:phage terminase large subunit [Planctomycetaceae bacterium]
MTVQITPKQREAAQLLGGTASNVMLYGGSRSGKTFLICWRLLHTALTCPCSRQAIIRRYFNSAKRSIVEDTFPKVLELEHVNAKYNHVDSKFSLPNGSEIWILGLDDKERTEKLLGQEFFTIYFNECSEMNWNSVNLVRTRNSMKIEKDIYGNRRRNRIFYDCNPPSKRHWSYKIFVEKIDPITRVLIRNPEQWDCMQLNPYDNREHLGDEYIDMVLEGFEGRMRERFLLGQFTDDAENALWKRSMIDTYRINYAPQDLERIVVGVDPSGSANASSSETGIIVAGKKWYQGEDHFYVLDDCTIHALPDVWSAAVMNAYNQNFADTIIAEINFGGAMVESVIRSAQGGDNAGFRCVRASHGKLVRAEPIATKYSRGLVHHVGEFSLLEDEMCSYTGAPTDDSPNRLDALVWAITGLSEGFTGTITQGDFSFI